MGLMRKVESRVERSVGATPRESKPGRPGSQRPKRDSKYSVHPAELARKLVKEMEEHKISHSEQEMVSNEYIIFLCPDDYARLSERRDEVLDKMYRHLAKHVRRKGYVLPGDLDVKMVRDDDLPFGKFGILAQMRDSSQPGYVPAPLVDTAPPPMPAPPLPAAAAAAAVPAGAGHTRVMRPSQSAEAGLGQHGPGQHILVIRAGNRVREFNQSRVIVGRSRDADFRVEDPNVSRRHAAIYWDGDRVMVQDLDSTNGTMVNGYPVTTTVLRPSDILVIGDCRITVDAR